MNYMTEIKLFYDRLETYPLPPAAIALWHALMFTANRCGWPEQFSASIGLLMLRTGLSRSTIYRERCRLREASRIAYRPQGGSADSVYEIHPLEAEFVSRKETQSDAASLFVSHGGTQHPAECEFASRDASHRGTRPYRLNRVFTEKEKTSKKGKEVNIGKKRKSCAKKRAMPRLNQEQFLSTLDEGWREPMSVWLEYKRTRRESYRSEMGAKKCLALLHNLSANDPSAAMAIIDRSIANNWAGLFPLRDAQSSHAARAGRGQHPGQIIQPSSDKRTQRLLEKFDRK